MPAYNREAICQFCNTKIIPPKKGFRSSANGNYICEDCVKLLGQALDVRGKSDGKAKAKKRNKKMTPREIKKELDKYIITRTARRFQSLLLFITIIKEWTSSQTSSCQKVTSC